MVNNLPLTRQDVIQMIEHKLDRLPNFDLVCIVNQYTPSWIRYNPDTDSFVWTSGERPSYLANVIDMDRLQEIQKETDRVDN